VLQRAVLAAVAGLALLADTAAAANPDPWQNVNRKIFWFNEQVDIYALAPVARGWRWITPSFARTGIRNFMATLRMPIVLGNDLLQLKAADAAFDGLRVVYNVSFGIAGLIDVASQVDIPANDEDFGQTLGYWGVPAGPYLVLPFLGPANIRDGIGLIGDAATGMIYTGLPFYGVLIVRGVDLVNWRSDYLEEVDENRRESFDYYVSLRDAYLQNRRARVGRDIEGEGEKGGGEDLYYFDDEGTDVGGGEEGAGARPAEASDAS
jgi:phospholipid-binding lipoprotein MlaA